MKRLRSVLILLAMLITSMGMGTNEIFANESFDVKENIVYNEDNTEATISLDIINIEGCTIEEVKNPDGNVMDINNLTYTATRNDTYRFEVTYLDTENVKQEYIKEVVVDGIEEVSRIQDVNTQSILASIDYTSQVVIDDWNLIDKNGNALSETNPISHANYASLWVKWTLTPGSGIVLHSGDTFIISKPICQTTGTWTALSSVGEWSDFKDENNVVLGRWRLSNQNIEVVLGENVEGKQSISGELLTGNTTYKIELHNGITQLVTVGKISKSITFIQTNLVEMKSDKDTKSSQNTSNTEIKWVIALDRTGVIELTDNPSTYTVRKNVIIEDTLAGDFSRLNIIASVFVPVDLTDGKASRTGRYMGATSLFTRIYQSEGQSYVDFKANMNVGEYGVYEDENGVQTVVVNFGDIGNNGMKFSDFAPNFAEETANYVISSGFYDASDKADLIEYFNNTYGDTNIIGGNILTYNLDIYEVFPKVISDTVKSNTATITTDGISKTVTGTGTLKSNIGSASAIDGDKARVWLSDADSNVVLDGVNMKIQRYDGSNWNDYGLWNGVINTDGYIDTDSLGDGTYRFVQQGTYSSEYDIPNSQGYDTALGKVVSSSFIIASGDTEGHEVYMTNVKYKYDVIYQPGSQGTFTTVTKNDVVINSTTPVFDGTLGSDNKPAGNVGYTFIGWSPVVDSTVTKDVTYVAQWTESTNTEYIVEHYLQQSNGTYVVEDTENLTGTTNATVTAEANSYVGYTLDTSVIGTKESGIVAGDGSLILKLYYIANINTAYKVEHYLQQPNGSYVVEETENLTGTTNATVIAEANSYLGYTLDTSVIGTKESGIVAGDGSLVLKLYYTANINTTYKVEHYLQQPNGSYALEETENLTGTTGNSVNAIIKEYDSHVFVEDTKRNTLTGVVEADGSLVLKVHYNLREKTPIRPEQNIDIKETIHDEDASGVSTGDATNSSLLVVTMLGMIGAIVVLLRNKKEQE